MISVNVNNYKIINDQYGIEKVDSLLCYIAHFMRDCTDKISGQFCRISADNFAVIYPAIYADSDAVKNSHQITMKLKIYRKSIAGLVVT